MDKLHRFLRFFARRGHLVAVVAVAVFVSQEWGVIPHHPMLGRGIVVFLFFFELPQILQLIIAVVFRNKAYLPSSWSRYAMLVAIVMVLVGIDSYRS